MEGKFNLIQFESSLSNIFDYVKGEFHPITGHEGPKEE
jgi:hypothetical protein